MVVPVLAFVGAKRLFRALKVRPSAALYLQRLVLKCSPNDSRVAGLTFLLPGLGEVGAGGIDYS